MGSGIVRLGRFHSPRAIAGHFDVLVMQRHMRPIPTSYWEKANLNFLTCFPEHPNTNQTTVINFNAQPEPHYSRLTLSRHQVMTLWPKKAWARRVWERRIEKKVRATYRVHIDKQTQVSWKSIPEAIEAYVAPKTREEWKRCADALQRTGEAHAENQRLISMILSRRPNGSLSEATIEDSYQLTQLMGDTRHLGSRRQDGPARPA